MLVKRNFTREVVVKDRNVNYSYFGKARPNAKEHCVGWYLFGMPLFVSIYKVEYYT
jgi:hypothetical protein